MKIGELAQKCGVTLAAIRFYVKHGLLVPDSSSAQYNFTERELQDLQLVLKMKRQGFSISEIQTYMSLIRHSNFIEPDTIAECIRMLSQKKLELKDRIASLSESLEDIERDIAAMSSRSVTHGSETGVPVSALHLLACPRCGRPLDVENARLRNGHIMSGLLSCTKGPECPSGYTAVIENGIIKTSNRYSGRCDHPDLTRGIYRNMGYELSLGFQHGYDRVASELSRLDRRGKVFLEAHVNGFFFLYNHLNLVPKDSLCIIADKYPEILEMYKTLIESLGLGRRMLYIADSEADYPLKKGCVDIHISFMGENEYQLYHENCYLHDVLPCLSDAAEVVGTYMSYQKNHKSRKNIKEKYLESSPRNYHIGCLAEDYEANGFSIETELMDTIGDTGKRDYSFECQVPGEPLSFYYFRAFRKEACEMRR